MQKIRKIMYGTSILLLCTFFLTGCSDFLVPVTAPKETGFKVTGPGTYDSADTAIITAIDTTGKTVTLKNPQADKYYTLSYTGTSCFYDKYGDVRTAAQFQPGEIVDLTFLRLKKELNTMKQSSEAWVRECTSGYYLDDARESALIGNEAFVCKASTLLLDDGLEMERIELQTGDKLTFRGIGSEVYSMTLDKGHGFLRLKNDEFFYDGWIEVGTSVIKKVTENMLLTIPEGTHQVLISKGGVSGVKTIAVNRNAEVVLDVGDLKGEDPKFGTVIFTITPNTANLYIDGQPTDYQEPVSLEYGIHQMIVMETGYETLTQYLKVGQESASIELSLDAKDSLSGNDPSVSDNDTVSGNAPSTPDGGTNATELPSSLSPNTASNTTSTQDYYAVVESPAGVEVYLDGNYIGIAPCQFKKEEGSHVITLRKTGYVSKSYNVRVDGESKNISFSFLALSEITG